MNRWSKKAKREGRKLRQTPLGYRPVTSKGHLFLELSMCSIMAATLYLLFMSATTVSTKAPTDPRIVVYDASLFAPCHPFMMLKQEQPAATTMATTSSSTSGGSPGPPPPPVNLTGGSSGSSSSSRSPSPPPPRRRRSLLQSVRSPTLTAAEVAYIRSEEHV